MQASTNIPQPPCLAKVFARSVRTVVSAYKHRMLSLESNLLEVISFRNMLCAATLSSSEIVIDIGMHCL